MKQPGRAAGRKPTQHLRPLRKRLIRLRRRRQRFRWLTAASALAIAVLWALAAVFALDWCFQRNVDIWQRLLLIVLAAAAVIAAFVRFAAPWLGRREDVTDMALLVQKQAGIDSDLVAALQFETTTAADWGSTQLETAVIDRVAARQRNLDVMAAVPRQPLARRLKVLLATVVVWILVGVLAPEHLWIFVQRLAFSSRHYPSQTRLLEITVNGKSVDLSASDAAAVHVPCGQTVRFEVTVAGSQPSAGRLELTTQAALHPANVPLQLVPGGDDAPAQARYQGEYVGLAQSAHYQIYLGDAYTDPLALSVTPLPVVEVDATVVPPVYARRSTEDGKTKQYHGNRQIAVLTGSEVRLTLNSDRPLKVAEITIAKTVYPMHQADTRNDGPEVWTLATAGTPLASVASELAYEIQVHDLEGQALDQPLQGTIAIEPDQPPGITASSKSTLVLPTASPSISYNASDDHALGCVWLTWEATSGDASETAEKREGRVEVCRFPPEESPRTREGDFVLPLRSLPLKPGDTLKVTFHVSDYRGPAAAETVDTDPPLVFQVTDLHGFEASMYEADQKSAGVLEGIRKKHSGLGETQ
jgi:hypothetical protein